MDANKAFPCETITYQWGDIKESIEGLEVKIPDHLASKNEDENILFLIYPGRMRQVIN